MQKFKNISKEAEALYTGEAENIRLLRSLEPKDFFAHFDILDLLSNYTDFNVIYTPEKNHFVVYEKNPKANPKRYPRANQLKTKFMEAKNIKGTIGLLIDHKFNVEYNDFCKLWKAINFTWTDKGIIMSNIHLISYPVELFVSFADLNKQGGQPDAEPAFNALIKEGKLRNFGLIAGKNRL